MSGIQMVCLIKCSDHLKTRQKTLRKVDFQILGVQYSDGYCIKVDIEGAASSFLFLQSLKASRQIVEIDVLVVILNVQQEMLNIQHGM